MLDIAEIILYQSNSVMGKAPQTIAEELKIEAFQLKQRGYNEDSANSTAIKAGFIVGSINPLLRLRHEIQELKDKISKFPNDELMQGIGKKLSYWDSIVNLTNIPSDAGVVTKESLEKEAQQIYKNRQACTNFFARFYKGYSIDLGDSTKSSDDIYWGARKAVYGDQVNFDQLGKELSAPNLFPATAFVSLANEIVYLRKKHYSQSISEAQQAINNAVNKANSKPPVPVLPTGAPSASTTVPAKELATVR